MINSNLNIANIAPVSIPDHSLLSWNNISKLEKVEVHSYENNETDYISFDLKKVPSNFLNDQSLLDEYKQILLL